MARPTLMSHRKFGRLAKTLGSKIVARGVLEILWDACYEAGDDYLGTAQDIDQLLGWSGDAGLPASALVACGLPEGPGFIEPSDQGNGTVTYRVHDLWHHAPDYVQKRHKREQERRQKSIPVSEDRRAGSDRRTAPDGGQRPTTPIRQNEVDHTRAPAPAPAPAPAQKNGSSAPLRDAEPVMLVFPVVGTSGHEWSLTQTHIAEWSVLYPTIDVPGECSRALAWIRADLQRRKTAKGMPRFLVDWFNRTVARGGSARPAFAAPDGGRSRTGASERLTPAKAAWREDCTHQPPCSTSTQHALALERAKVSA